MAKKFNINRPPVPDEEINSHKDFGELVKAFKQQSIEKAKKDSHFSKSKKITYSTIIAGVAVICTVTYFSVFKKQPPKVNQNENNITLNTNSSSSKTSNQNKAFIAPPIAKLNTPYTTYKVNAEQGATLKHSSNSKIKIPKKAFVNKQGDEIVGDVEIKYREFHNQADIITSGIPMEYDSAGVKSTLESAGMIDIKGFQNGEPVFINPKKQIVVEFSSEHTEDKYNMYHLDTIAKNWTYLGRDNSLKANKTNQENKKHNNVANASNTQLPKNINDLQKQIDAIPPKIETEKITCNNLIKKLPVVTSPIKPTKSIEGRPQFKLDVSYKEFPELAAFKNAVFEVGEENKNYSSKLADITWTSAEVSEGPQKGKNYLLTLTLGNRVEKLVVYPALTGVDYDKAIKNYESKFENYKALIVKREADEKRLKAEFEAKQAAYAAEMKKLSEQKEREYIQFLREQQKKNEEQFALSNGNEKVMRIFNISNFGIYNSDCPKSFPIGESINPTYITNQSKINPEVIYLVCHNKNLVYTLGNKPLTFNPEDTYSLCILSQGRMYLCDKETFSEAISDKASKILLKELDTNVDNPKDLKLAMGI